MAAVAAVLSLCFSAPCPASAGPQCRREVVTVGGDVGGIAVSHDDTLAAVVWGSGYSVFNVATGAALPVPSYIFSQRAVAFSPAANEVALGMGSGRVAVVNLSSGAEVWSDDSKGNDVVQLAYSPDGTRVAAGHLSGDISIWNAATGASTFVLGGSHTGRVEGLTYTLDGGRILSASADGRVRVWNAATGAHIKTMTEYPHTTMAGAIQVSPDGLYFATLGYEKADTANVYKLSDFSLHKKIATGFYSYGMSFSQDWSKLAVVGVGDMKVYSVETGNLLQSHAMASSGFTEAVSYLHTSDTIITAEYSGGSSRVLLRDDVAPTPPPSPAPTPVPHSCEVSDTFVSVCGAGASQRCVLRIQHAGGVLSVAHSPDGAEIAAGGADGVVRVFSAATGAQLRSLACGGFAAHDVAFSPDGMRVAAGGAGGRAVVCDATTGAVLLDLEHGDAVATPVRRVRFSPDGRLLVVGGVEEEVTRVHDAVEGVRSEQVLHMHARDVAFLPAGAGSGSGSGTSAARLAAVTAHAEVGEAVRVFAVDNGRQEAAVVSVGARVTALSFSPGGDELARGMDDGTVRVGLWAGNAASERLRLRHASGFVFDVQHSPDGRLVAAVGVGPAAVWGTSGGATLAELVGHAGGVHRLSFSPSGTRVATAGHDGQLLVWDVSGL